MDRLIELQKWIETQEKVFTMLPLKSPYQDGILEGLNLVKKYITFMLDNEMADIAEALNGK